MVATWVTYVIKSDCAIDAAPIRQQCYRNNAYRRQQIEDSLANIEGRHSGIVRRLMVSDANFVWKGVFRREVFDVLGLMLSRNIHNADKIRRSLEATTENLKRGGYSLDAYKQAKSDYEKCDFTMLLLSMYKDYMKAISDMGIVVLNNASNQPFITCDNPVVIYNILFQDIRENTIRGIGSTGAIIYLPVCGHKALFLYDKSVYRVKRLSDCYVNHVTDDDVEFLNAMIVINAKDCVYSNNLHLDYLVKIGGKFSSRKREKSICSVDIVDEKGKTKALTYESFPNLSVELSFVTTPQKIMETRFRRNKLRDGKKVVTPL